MNLCQGLPSICWHCSHDHHTHLSSCRSLAVLNRISFEFYLALFFFLLHHIKEIMQPEQKVRSNQVHVTAVTEDTQ